MTPEEVKQCIKEAKQAARDPGQFDALHRVIEHEASLTPEQLRNIEFVHADFERIASESTKKATIEYLTTEQCVIQLAAIYNEVWDVDEFRWKANEYMLTPEKQAQYDDMKELEFLLGLKK